MHFIQLSSRFGVQALTTQITSELLAGKRVLWLISGGSNIPLTVEAMNLLPDELTAELAIMPVDERYGPVGHPNSNVQQLLEAGFQPKLARFIPVLTGEDLATTVKQYNATAAQELSGRVVIAQLGMGADGHVAGLLPHSPACDIDDAAVTSFTGPDFTRITMTFPALRNSMAAYLFAYGDNKRVPLQRLQGEAAPLADQPVQILKEIPSAYIYNDQLEGEEIE